MAKSLDLDLGMPSKLKNSHEKSRSSINTKKREAGAQVDLNFKVSSEFRREFKLWAASHDMKQKEVLEEAFRLLKQRTL
jgi:CCR4-NOT transcriptional regulation complex NOT5 subunit